MFFRMIKQLDEINIDLMKKNNHIRNLEEILSVIHNWYVNDSHIKEMPEPQKILVDILFTRAEQVLKENK
jgi:hypothetical protein